MVASKTKKTVKYTYAERVLSALSHAQQEHRKHAVHHATLRAEVRKRADAKKDKLGPQWSSWVRRTVQRLEDRGALEPSEPQGSVMLTPNAKKAISEARRHLHVDGHPTHSPVIEDEVWKIVSQQFSSGLKRKKSAMSISSNQEEDEDSEGEVISAVNGSPSKRLRRSSARYRKSQANMTRAELQQELRALQQAHGEATSGLQFSQAETDESRRLRNELAAKEREIEAVRNELDQIKSAAVNVSGGPPGDSISRSTTPDRSSPLTSSSSFQPNVVNVGDRPRALQGIVRTQSGSFISQFSKQPTPAPSAPGSPGPMDDISMGLDDGDDMGPFELADISAASDDALGAARLLLTPQSSPSKDGRAAGVKQMDLRVKLKNLQDLLEAERKTLQDRIKEYQDQVEALEQTSNSRASELRSKEDIFAHERSSMQSSLNDQGARITQLMFELKDQVQLAAAKDAILANKDSEITDLNASLASLERTASDRQVKLNELEIVIREKELSINAIAQEKQHAEEELYNLRQNLSDVQGLLQKTQDQLDDSLLSLRSMGDRAATELRAERARNEGLRNEIEMMEGKLRELQQSESALRCDNEILSSTVANLERALKDNEAARSLAADELEQLNGTNSSLSAQLHVLESIATSLTERLNAAVAENSQLQAQLAETGAIKEKLEERQQQISLYASECDHLKTQATSLQNSIASLREQLKTSNDTAEGMKAELTHRVQNLESVVAEKENTVFELESSKTQFVQQVSSLQTDLVHTKAHVLELELSLDELRDRLKKRDGQVERLQRELHVTEQSKKEILDDVKRLENANAEGMHQLAEKELATERLSEELVALQNKERALLYALDETKAARSADAMEHESTISSLKSSLEVLQNEANDLKSHLESAIVGRAELESRLEECQDNLASTRASLESEKVRAQSLESDLVDAVGARHHVQDELDGLRDLKKADEATITRLVDGYARLREVQMNSLAEFDQTIANTAPPQRLGSSS